MYKIVGSTAAARALPDWKRRNDLDVWQTPNGFKQENYPDQRLDCCIMPTEILMAFQGKEYATLNDLYTIKVSHLVYDIFWSKHASDALVFHKKGAELNQELYPLLREYWKGKHGNKDFLSLYKTKDEFFNDAVTKIYDHDYLHELVAYPHQPIYKSVLKDGHTVYTDKNKWYNLPFESKVKMLREEMVVIACERWLIPFRRNRPTEVMTFPMAWSLSVRKTATALTKGDYSAFIAENLSHFIKPSKDEVSHLFETLGL